VNGRGGTGKRIVLHRPKRKNKGPCPHAEIKKKTQGKGIHPKVSGGEPGKSRINGDSISVWGIRSGFLTPPKRQEGGGKIDIRPGEAVRPLGATNTAAGKENLEKKIVFSREGWQLGPWGAYKPWKNYSFSAQVMSVGLGKQGKGGKPCRGHGCFSHRKKRNNNGANHVPVSLMEQARPGLSRWGAREIPEPTTQV